MASINSWKSKTAALMALAITTSAAAPVFTSTPVSAQLFPSSRNGNGDSTYRNIIIPTGTNIPVRYDKAEKIVVSPKERLPVTLTVASNIVNRSGTVLIPAGSTIEGELRPAEGGSQFVARELVTYNRRQPIDATSRVISQTTVNRGTNTSSIVKGAVIGAAASAALAGLTGDRHIGLGEVLIGTGAGAAGGVLLGKKKADVVVIEPDSDLEITLRSSLALR